MLHGHRDLKVYQLAYQLAMKIFEESKGFPREERYSLTDQVRRSSRSVAANIAEAYRRRRYPAMFVSRIVDADAEATETQVWIDPSTRAPALAGGSCSGFRPTGVLEGATGLPVGLHFAFDCGYLSKKSHDELCRSYEEVGKMLGSILVTPERFTGDTKR